MRERRARRDVHWLDDDGMVACNPRDPEAAHRAEVADLRVGAGDAVTCAACITRMRFVSSTGRRT
jgi:hypothetical protein